MTFKELLEKYKNGTASPAEREQVEREMEKYEAISEHYMNEIPLEEEEPKKNEAEWKRIRGKMKKRTALLLVFILVAVIVASWSSIAINGENYLSRLWYSPTESNFGEKWATDLELALEAATELYMPAVRTEYVISERTGAGRYNLAIQQWDNFDGELRYCFGTVDRNRIRLNQDFFCYEVANAFERSDRASTDPGILTPKEEIMEKIGMLSEYIRCETYVSFGEDVTMETLAEILEKYDLYAYWVGVRADAYSVQRIPLIGFNPSGAGYIHEVAEKKYPYYEISEHRKEDMGMVFEEHFKSLLRLAMDENLNGKLNLIGFDGRYQETLDYVEENGVKSYGFVAPLTREEIAQLAEEEVVSSFYIKDLQLDTPWE